jgi:hypothetical protein
MKYIIKKSLREATGSGSSGSFKTPINFAPLDWGKEPLEPFNIRVSDYLNPTLAHDSYDGHMDISKERANKIEKLTKKISRMASDNFSQNDGDGNPLNGFIPKGDPMDGTPGYKSDLVKEATESTWSSGEYNLPLEHGLRDWKKPSLVPFDIEVGHIHTNHAKNNELDDLIVHHIKSLTEQNINEDLGVWFGTKNKPKGSKQPKGPWVNICRKKEGGGHPPCGRPDASDKSYPKCRAAGVASKMTDSQKRSACQQKRKAEKSHPKSGTGNKPKMTHYEPKNESTRDLIKRILKENFN